MAGYYRALLVWIGDWHSEKGPQKTARMPVCGRIKMALPEPPEFAIVTRSDTIGSPLDPLEECS